MIKKIIGIMVATSFCFIMQAQQVFTDVRVIAERSNSVLIVVYQWDIMMNK